MVSIIIMLSQRYICSERGCSMVLFVRASFVPRVCSAVAVLSLYRRMMQVLRRALCYGPMAAYLRPLLPDAVLHAVKSLASGDYSSWPVDTRIAVLKALTDAVSATDSFGDEIANVGADREELIKDRQAADMEDERELREEQRKLKELQRAEQAELLADLALQQEQASASSGGSANASSTGANPVAAESAGAAPQAGSALAADSGANSAASSSATADGASEAKHDELAPIDENDPAYAGLSATELRQLKLAREKARRQAELERRNGTWHCIVCAGSLSPCRDQVLECRKRRPQRGTCSARQCGRLELLCTMMHTPTSATLCYDARCGATTEAVLAEFTARQAALAERRRREIEEELRDRALLRDLPGLKAAIEKARQGGFESGRGAAKRVDPELQKVRISRGRPFCFCRFVHTASLLCLQPVCCCCSGTLNAHPVLPPRSVRTPRE